MKKSTKALLLIFGILLIDQVLKFWIKLNMGYGEEFLILGQEWARIHFVENEGMAFGIKYGGEWGKLALSIFRVIAAGFLTWIIIRLVKADEKWGVIAGVSMIFAGAFGNIIDSAFYGLIFSESYYGSGVAELFPEEGGYTGFLYGRVVDMFYFPLIDTTLPDWVPLKGGERFRFFRPVFNVADSAITTGVIYLLLFEREFFKK